MNPVENDRVDANIFTTIFYSIHPIKNPTIMEQLGIKWSPHCTRHTTISMMKEHRIDETTIKKIVGHSGAMTLTERVYTHLDVRVLIDAINKIVGERENGMERKKNKQKKADTDNATMITHICFSYLYLFTLNLTT